VGDPDFMESRIISKTCPVQEREEPSVSSRKKCTKCLLEKVITDFHSKGVGRWESRCKICSNDVKNEKNRAKKMKAQNRSKRQKVSAYLIDVSTLRPTEIFTQDCVDQNALGVLLTDFVLDTGSSNEKN